MKKLTRVSFVLTVGLAALAFEACGGDDGPACPQTDCDGNCVDTRYDPANCGECGNSCASGEVCSSGTCATSCSGGSTECGGGCVDTNANANHCGACDAACGAGEVCDGGTCAASCGGGTTECGSACVDTNVDPAHCGGCDAACGTGEVCDAGTCTPTCASPNILCEGKCIDPMTDANYCGATGACTGLSAGEACAAGEVCDGAGTCDTVCATNFLKCDGTCVDPMTDRNYCGASGACSGGTVGEACTPGEYCVTGACDMFATCQEIKTAGFDAGDGVYTIDPSGNGDTSISVWCDMATGTTYEEFATGNYDGTYTGYATLSLADFETTAVQEAFRWFYNSNDGINNIDEGFTEGNCCIQVPNADEIGLGGATNLRLRRVNDSAEVCNGAHEDARYHIGPSGSSFLPPLALDFFTANPPTSSNNCSDSNNPGILVKRYQ